MLYLIATPIGNFSDLSPRAIHVLKEVSCVLVEDTRRAGLLFSHFGITTKMRSFHHFSESRQMATILSLLKQGEKIALISDAGMPAISDPGAQLVAQCHDSSIPVKIIPGPSAVIAAAAMSGYEGPFQFVGFIPKEAKESFWIDLLFYPGLTIAFDSPLRIIHSLEILSELEPGRKAAIFREITKTHEEWVCKPCHELLSLLQSGAIKTLGEYVLLIYPHQPINEPNTLGEKERLLIDQLIKDYKMPPSRAIAVAAEATGIKKQLLYKMYLQ